MKLGALVEHIDKIERAIPASPVSDLERQLVEVERMLQQNEALLEIRRQQRTAEKNLGSFLTDLEHRTKVIQEEALSLESTPLSQQALRVRKNAEKIAHDLADLRKRIFQEREVGLGSLQQQAGVLHQRVEQLEHDFERLVASIDEKEREARAEDQLETQIQQLLLELRIAEFYFDKARNECTHLQKRMHHFERALRVIRAAQQKKQQQQAVRWPHPRGAQFDQQAAHLHENARRGLDEIRNLISEGICDVDISGKEVHLAYAVQNMWKKGKRAEFYNRLWALHLLLMKAPNPNEKLIQTVRSLLTFINTADGVQNNEQERAYANEGRRFLLMAGRGSIRQLLERDFRGLKTQADLADLGRELHRPNSKYLILQLAVNIPRLYDLELTDTFERIYERRTVRKAVNNVSPFFEMRQIDSLDEVEDVSPEEFDPLFLFRLMDGDVIKRQNIEQRVERRQVGIERFIQAQIYLLDMSGSMNQFGSKRRWLIRDAIWMAALNTYSVDASVKKVKKFPNKLYLHFFGGHVAPIEEVTDSKEAFESLVRFYNGEVPVIGDTDIGSALETGYKDIHDARGKYHQLRNAKVVLVTDGEPEQHPIQLGRLLRLQNFTGTNIVTNVFMLENNNPEIRQLCERSAPGKAFPYLLDGYSIGRYAALPPYGSAEEFSPVYQEPLFQSTDKKRAYQKRVTELCKELFDAANEASHETSAREKTARSVVQDLSKRPPRGAYEAYEINPRTQQPDPAKLRKCYRVEQVLHVLSEDVDEYTDVPEFLELLKSLAGSRAVVFKDLAEIFKRSEDTGTRQAIDAFSRDVVSKMIAKGKNGWELDKAINI